MENEKIKVKIEIDFTYNATALKIIERLVKEHNERENQNVSLEEFLDRAIENMMYDRFECDYDCIDGEEYEVNWTIEKS
jgi:hypothetical protein